MAVTINADNGVSSGSAGLKQTADSTGVLALQTNGTTAVTVDTSQNVGIGTSNTPSNKDTVTPKLVVNGSGVAGAIQVVRNTTVGAGGAILELTATRGSDVNSYTILQSGDGIGTVVFGGADGNEFVVAGSVQCQVDGTPGDNDMPGRLTFNTTADGASSPSERMRIDSSGNVGIGTSSFTHPFTVKKSNAGDWTCKFSNSSATGVSGFGYYDNSDTWKGYVGYDNGDANFLKLYATTSVGIKFITNTTEAMRIDSSGNLLVNTTTAQTGAKLAVTGGIQGTIQSGTAVASTSGTSINFTGIPSWVKRVTVMLSGVSTNGTSPLTLRIGTSGGIVSSGYTGSAFYTSSAGNFSLDSTGYPLTTTAITSAAGTYRGSIIISLLGSNIWIAQGTLNSSVSGGTSVWISSEVTLGGTLDRVRLTTLNGTDTFDAGSVNIMYEG